MDYCIFRFNKIKSRSMMKQVYDHHFRFAEPVNVDKEYEALNDHRVTPDGDYISRFHERLNELEYYKDHNFRKNGVMASTSFLPIPLPPPEKQTLRSGNRIMWTGSMRLSGKRMSWGSYTIMTKPDIRKPARYTAMLLSYRQTIMVRLTLPTTLVTKPRFQSYRTDTRKP